MESTFFIPKVENYFSSYNSSEPWLAPGAVANVEFKAERSALVVTLEPDAAGVSRLVLIELPHACVFRLRFDPRAMTLDEYPDENTRTVVMDHMAELRAVVGSPTVDLEPEIGAGGEIVAWVATTSAAAVSELRLRITRAQFELQVFRPDGNGGWFLVVQDQVPGILFRPVLDYQIDGSPRREYQVLRRTRKPVTARYAGFGEKAGADIIKNGKQLTYVNCDNWGMSKWYPENPRDDREPLYNSNPFFLEYNGAEPRRSLYGVLVDNTAPLYLDVGATLADTVQIGSLYDDLDLYHFFGPDTQAVLLLLTEFVGRSRLKPRHVLGYHQGCYGYERRSDVERVAQKYRDYQIPIDGLHIDIDMQFQFRTFTVDEHTFPKPSEMFSQLGAKGYKCSTNITPFIRDDGANNTVFEDGRAAGAFVLDRRSTGGINPNPPEGTIYRGGVPYAGFPRGVYPDLGQRAVRDWWGVQYRYLLSLGLEMVWQDMTTPCMKEDKFSDWLSFPLHLLLTNDERKKYQEGGPDDGEALTALTPAVLVRNLYAYNLVKATYHGLNADAARAGRRNFIIARGGFTGMHRFAALWTGDNMADWPYLKLNILQSLAGGLSGQPMTGADIGGFGGAPGGLWADPELIIRWTIAGAFLPWFRNHYSRKDSLTGRFQEPWAFYENRHRALEEDRWLYDLTLIACRHYINLRYRLLQLFYDALFENTRTGLPIVRPLFVNDDHDPHLFYDKRQFLNSQWFVGRDFMVAPFLEKGGAHNGYGVRQVYLPQGSSWYTFMNNVRPLLAAAPGGQQVDYDAHLSLDPDHLNFLCAMFVRAGAILPTIELEQYVGQITRNGKPATPITINIYPNPAPSLSSPVSYHLHEDDGVSRDSAYRPPGPEVERLGIDPKADNKHRHTEISHAFASPKTRVVTLERKNDGYIPEPGYYFLAILHDPSEPTGGAGASPLEQLSHGNTVLPPLTGGDPDQLAALLAASDDTAWYYHTGLRISFIKLVAPESYETFTATYL